MVRGRNKGIAVEASSQKHSDQAQLDFLVRYQELWLSIMKDVNYRCQTCGVQGASCRSAPSLAVHHS